MCGFPASTVSIASSRSRKSGVRTSMTMPGFSMRSEEHTSELQSPCNLVCRLLLEKKKQTILSYPACYWHSCPALHRVPAELELFAQNRSIYEMIVTFSPQWLFFLGEPDVLLQRLC